jgi:CAAX protease family protein
MHTIFINKYGRLRSGWRLAIFVFGFILFSVVAFVATEVLARLTVRQPLPEFFASLFGASVNAFLTLAGAILLGWLCCRLLEDLPFKALGWSKHSGWLRDFLIGSAVGAVSLLLAFIIPAASGGYSIGLSQASAVGVLKTLLISLAAYILFAASEEALFRGYPLQTMTRAHLAWVSILLTSITFSSAHLANPNVVAGFTFINTLLAGVWLAIAYLKTRSMWFPLGVHWAWNWTMGSVLGIPVSGITTMSAYPLLHSNPTGPAWLTGGTYGLEGGAACTVALAISTIWIWRTKTLAPSPEMLELTEHENPVRPDSAVAPELLAPDDV